MLKNLEEQEGELVLPEFFPMVRNRHCRLRKRDTRDIWLLFYFFINCVIISPVTLCFPVIQNEVKI